MKNLKNLVLFIAIISSISLTKVNAQSIEENTSIELEKIKISYKILNHTVKEIQDVEYDRYEVKFEAKNISNSEIAIFEGDIDETKADYSEKQNKSLVVFNCLNANGKRLTSKQKTLALKPHKISYRFKGYDKDGKSKIITKYMITAHYLKKGELVSENALFIVPKGEKPDITYSELN